MNTRLTLFYRDAANYKAHETVVLAGCFTPEQVEAIRAKFDDGEFIIPCQVGLPNPAAQFQGRDDFPNEDLDHVWVQMADFVEESDVDTLLTEIMTDANPTIRLSAAELAASFARLEAWDVEAAWSDMRTRYGT